MGCFCVAKMRGYLSTHGRLCRQAWAHLRASIRPVMPNRGCRFPPAFGKLTLCRTQNVAPDRILQQLGFPSTRAGPVIDESIVM